MTAFNHTTGDNLMEHSPTMPGVPDVPDLYCLLHYNQCYRTYCNGCGRTGLCRPAIPSPAKTACLALGRLLQPEQPAVDMHKRRTDPVSNYYCNYNPMLRRVHGSGGPHANCHLNSGAWPWTLVDVGQPVPAYTAGFGVVPWTGMQPVALRQR